MANNAQVTTTLKPTTWVDKYADKLYRFALMRVSDKEVAEDLVQDAFLSALKNAENFRGEVSEINWLYTILKGKIIDHYKKASTRLSENIGDTPLDFYFEKGGHWAKKSAPANWDIAYDTDRAETADFYHVLENCKHKLKEIQNAVFTLKYIDDKDSEDICKELGISSSNYWVLLHRAKLQLRECIERNWFDKK